MAKFLDASGVKHFWGKITDWVNGLGISNDSIDKLTSLKGAPVKVGGNFSCFECDGLASLEGAPREVGGSFDCYGCHKLTSLDGTPEKIGGKLYCHKCKNLSITLRNRMKYKIR